MRSEFSSDSWESLADELDDDAEADLNGDADDECDDAERVGEADECAAVDDECTAAFTTRGATGGIFVDVFDSLLELTAFADAFLAEVIEDFGNLLFDFTAAADALPVDGLDSLLSKIAWARFGKSFSISLFADASEVAVSDCLGFALAD